MFKNYLTTALRNLRKHPGHTALSIVGLAVGVAACLLIGLYVQHETSYDRHLGHADRIARIVWHSDNAQTRTPHPMALAAAADLPAVENGTSLSPIWGPGLTRPTFRVRAGDRVFEEAGILSADSTFFDVFDYALVAGDRYDALRLPGGLVLTERTALKYFGTTDAVGRTVEVNGDTELFVTAVMEDVPATSHVQFDALVSYVSMKLREGEGSEYYTWNDFGHYNYLLLRPDADIAALQAQLNDWVQNYIQPPPDMRVALEAGHIGFRLQPLTDIHLRSHLRWELEPNGNIAYVWLFGAAALFILLIAGANFVNLTTARAIGRAKEVGVRKTLGAARRQVVTQFLAESLLVSAAAVAGAVALVEVTLPAFNGLLGTALAIDYADTRWLLLLPAFVAAIGLLAGSYPALVLAGVRPMQVLKGRFSLHQGAGLRRALVATQFTVSIALLVGVFVVHGQLRLLTDTALGFDGAQVVTLPLNGPDRGQYDALRDRLETVPGVTQVAAVSNVPGGRFNLNPVQWQADAPTVDVNEWRVDDTALDALGLSLVEGRAFDRDRPADREAVLLNETAARTWDGGSPVGQTLTWFDNETTRRVEVIGVVRDFHLQSLHASVAPLLIQYAPESVSSVLVRLDPSALQTGLPALADAWAEVLPATPFAPTFLNAQFGALYRAERQTRWLFGAFAGLAVVLACLGLFALAAVTAQQRAKEIGVRKVMGATVPHLVFWLTGEFVRLVAMAFVLAAPFAWWVMDAWLADFAHRITIGPGLIVLAGALTLLVAFITVSLQALRAALADPIRALRYE